MMPILKSLLSLSLLATVACTAELGGTGGDGTGADGGVSADATPPEVCEEAVQIQFEQRQLIPDILLVLDRSGSMGDRLVSNNSTSKWDIIRPAIADVVNNTGASVNYGLMLFPNNNDCQTGRVRVPNALNNGTSILNEMNGSSPRGGTPTHQSLNEAKSYYDGFPVNEDGRVVLLATDGIPTCNSSTNASVSAIQNLAQTGIATYVLGFGFGDADISGLQAMAAAGGGGQVYPADSPAQLQAAFDAILGDITVPSCEFQLQQTPSNTSDINISFNGVELVRDDPNGWSYDEATKTITLLGASCESVKSGGASGIDVDLGCEGVIIE